MDLKTFEKIHNRQMSLVAGIIVMFVTIDYLTTAEPLQHEYFSQHERMFALIIGMLIWMVGVTLTVLGIKKGKFK